MSPAIRALLRAAADGDAHRVRALLVQGTDVNSTNAAGQTSLMLAAAFNHREVVRVLLNAGANIEVQDDLGLNALDWARNSTEALDLINTALKASEPVSSDELSEPVQTIPRSAAEISAVAPPGKPSSPPEDIFVKKPALKGLAGAILRDYKPKIGDDAPVVSPTPMSSPPIAPPQPNNSTASHLLDRPDDDGRPTESADDTLDTSLRVSQTNVSDDTVVPVSKSASRSRIFDLDSSSEPPPEIRKVKVDVPSFDSRASRRRPFVWALQTILLAAIVFGSYRLVLLLLTTPTTNTPSSQVQPSAVAQPTAVPAKSALVIGGDLVGTELHLPDAEYPRDLTQGQNGNVTVNVRVSSNGRVILAKAIEGNESLRVAAEKAAKSAAFSPDKLQGKGSVIEGTITYNFVAPTDASLGNKPSPVADVPTRKGVSAIAGGPLAGAELRLVQPEYPTSVRRQGAGGTVTIVVRVNRAGQVTSWRPLDGDDRLRALAIKAARQSTFSPDKLPGKRDVVGTITYTFR